MSTQDKFKALMETSFAGTNPNGYSLENYYGVMIMRVKRNGKYQIRLQYDYKNRNMVNGKPVEFSTLEVALLAYEILDNNSKESRDDKKQENIESMLLA